MDDRTIVRAADVAQAMRALGIGVGDVVLVHSSMKSMGYVDGGPETVIAGIESVIGKEGTLVLPTLSQVDFTNSYKTWYMDKPSDVGLLTEYFRKQMYVYRSNQETHSVAARGRLAYELTWEHKARGPHLCPFGNYAFADSSPWAKMEEAAKIVFIGVGMNSNTIKHMVEGRFVEALLAAVKDEDKRAALLSRVRQFEMRDLPDTVWPYFNGIAMQEDLDAAGLLSHAALGDAALLCVNAKVFCAEAFERLMKQPQRYLNEETMAWVDHCRKAAED